MTVNELEKKNKRIAAVTSIGVHVVLFLFFLFAVAWRAPDPPLPEFGIELNFGLDTQGSGDIQPETPVGSDQDADKAEQSQSEELQEEKQAEAKPSESTPVEQQVTSKHESPIVVKEEKKETKPVETKVKTEEKKEVTPKEDSKAIYKPNTEKTESKTGQPGNQGDDVNKAGDKGDLKGSLDAKALYGKPGGGGEGVGLSIAGWDWLDKPDSPQPTENDQFSGRVVFKIIIDENGEIVDIKKIEGTLSSDLERKCKEEIQKSSLQKTSPGKALEKTTGTVTFNLRIQ